MEICPPADKAEGAGSLVAQAGMVYSIAVADSEYSAVRHAPIARDTVITIVAEDPSLDWSDTSVAAVLIDEPLFSPLDYNTNTDDGLR